MKLTKREKVAQEIQKAKNRVNELYNLWKQLPVFDDEECKVEKREGYAVKKQESLGSPKKRT